MEETAIPQLKRFWILGAGRFGNIALERIRRNFPGAAITVVDLQPPQIGDRRAITLVAAEAVAWLAARLDRQARVDLIVPAIPVHVAAQWLKHWLSAEYEILPAALPEQWLERLPNACRGVAGQIFVSNANFLCPDDCPEPARMCTRTGRPRPSDLYRRLADLDQDGFVPLVLRSHQLLPGVGAVYPADLLDMLDRATAAAHRPLMVATACRCHGVLDCLSLRPRR